MLRTNLSTRPFYNDRAIRLAIAIGAVAVGALTAFNAAEILTLNDRNNELVARAAAAEGRARELRDRANATRKTMDQGEVSAVQTAAREANLLIERRAFSWTDLFNRFEETLPADVRIAAVQPQIDDQGRMLVAVSVVSRRVEDLNAFIDQLEQTGAFRGVLSRQDTLEDDEMLRSVIQGYYTPLVPVPAAAPSPTTSDRRGATPMNTTPSAPSAAPGGADR